MTKKREPWQKTLYGNVGYADNYTDPSFLKDLQKNKHVKTFHLTEAIRGATRLNHQVSCVVAFLLVFHAMHADSISPGRVLFLSTSITTLAYMFHSLRRDSPLTLFDDCKTVGSVLVFGHLLSPLLHTLTNSISTDTIFTITFFVMFLHLAFFDYGLPAFMVSKAVSLNAAIFGTICLVSRLRTPFHAFTLLVVAAEFFALYPIFVRVHWSPAWIVPVTLSVCLVLMRISWSLLIVYVLGSVFINFVCPYCFVQQQRHKNNIHGPWDEAIVEETDLTVHCKGD